MKKRRWKTTSKINFRHRRTPHTKSFIKVSTAVSSSEGEKPRKHTRACACPNCNFLRKRILEDRDREEVKIRVLEDDRVLEMVGDDPEAVLRPETTMANELKRRERISKANKGNVPWNKGRRHSPETIEKIRRKTMERMKSPEVRAKIREAALLNAGKLSPHTKMRISRSVRDAMKKKKLRKSAKRKIV